MPKFYIIIARNVFPDFFGRGWGARAPLPPVSYAYDCIMHMIYIVVVFCVPMTLSGWMVDAESRPTFTELYAEFSKMSKDPRRFLVIPVKLQTIKVLLLLLLLLLLLCRR